MDRIYGLILGVSFMPLLYKVVLYGTIDAFEPLLIASVFGVWFLLGYFFKSKWLITGIKAWAISLMIYAIIRLLLQGLLRMVEVGVEAQIMAQLNLGYAIMSLIYLFLGRWLMRNRKRVKEV